MSATPPSGMPIRIRARRRRLTSSSGSTLISTTGLLEIIAGLNSRPGGPSQQRQVCRPPGPCGYGTAKQFRPRAASWRARGKWPREKPRRRGSSDATTIGMLALGPTGLRDRTLRGLVRDHGCPPLLRISADPGEGLRGPITHGAGEGNRTLVVSLGSFCSAIELHPHVADHKRSAAGCKPSRGRRGGLSYRWGDPLAGRPEPSPYRPAGKLRGSRGHPKCRSRCAASRPG